MRMMHALLLGSLLASACGGEPPARTAASAAPEGTLYTTRDTTIPATFDAVGAAEAIERATVSTKLMGSVTQVLVQEGDRVARGAVLARIDARDVQAKRAQVDAGIAAAEAMYQDALTQANRFRALYADSAATRYQLDQVETGLARAESGLRTARAAREELDAVGAYAEVRAPFAGVVTSRHVDPGAFAAPGAPIAEVQDLSRLRVSVSVPPSVGLALKRGQRLAVEVEGRAVTGAVEGIVPAPAGGVSIVNVLVDNVNGTLPGGGAATVRIPQGTRSAILVPAAALVREGDLVGVHVKTGTGAELRWVRTGAGCRAPGADGTSAWCEILSGVSAGDVVIVKAS
jgi:RND family efflux transporter MFP subunit